MCRRMFDIYSLRICVFKILLYIVFYHSKHSQCAREVQKHIAKHGHQRYSFLLWAELFYRLMTRSIPLLAYCSSYVLIYLVFTTQ